MTVLCNFCGIPWRLSR